MTPDNLTTLEVVLTILFILSVMTLAVAWYFLYRFAKLSIALKPLQEQCRSVVHALNKSQKIASRLQSIDKTQSLVTKDLEYRASRMIRTLQGLSGIDTKFKKAAEDAAAALVINREVTEQLRSRLLRIESILKTGEITVKLRGQPPALLGYDNQSDDGGFSPSP